MTPSIFWILVTAIPLPLVSVYLLRLWNIEQYSFFPIMFVAVFAMAYNRWDKQWYGPRKRLVTLFLTLAVILQLFASLIWSPWLAYLGFVLSFTCLLASHQEKKEKEGHEPWSNGSLLYLSIPLWLCLRIPFGQDQTLTLRLQHFTASVSSYVLDLLSVPHRISGIIFDLPGGKLFVEEACSGVQSLFALMCVALLLVAYNRRPIILVPVYCLAAIFSAGLLNIVRVTSIAISQEWYQYDLASGVPHEILGYTCLALAILLLGSFDRLFQIIFYPLSEADSPIAQEMILNPFKLCWNKLFTAKPFKAFSLKPNQTLPKFYSGVSIVCFVIAWSTQSIVGVQALNGGNIITAKPEAIWLPPPTLISSSETLQVENYDRQVGQNDISEGEYVDVWNVFDKTGVIRHRVAISQPYVEFHDLCACYRGVGWQLENRQNVLTPEANSDTNSDWPFVLAKFVNANGNYAYLSFSGIDDSASPVPPPGDNIRDLFKQRIWNGFSNTSGRKVMMFQIWTTSDEPLSLAQIEELKKIHLALRAQSLAVFRSQQKGK
jgi:exosortase